MPFNLDELMDKTIDFILFGELVRVQQPSVSMIKKINKFQMEAVKINENNTDVIFASQCDITCSILNNNSSGKKFTVKQMESLPQNVHNKILSTILTSVLEDDNDPN